MEKPLEKKVIDLKPGMENLNLKLRVLEAKEARTIQTRKGVRTISEAIVGDESGRIKLTLWGRHAGLIKEGDAIEVKGAFTTQYRGEVQLNLGSKGSIKQLDKDIVPPIDEIPDLSPKAPRTRSKGGFQRRQGKRSYPFRRTR